MMTRIERRVWVEKVVNKAVNNEPNCIAKRVRLRLWPVAACISLALSSIASAELNELNNQHTEHQTITHKVKEIPSSQFQWGSPHIPDSSVYNLQNVREKIPQKKTAVISIQRLVRKGPLKDFVRNTRLLEWAKRQLSSPKVIEIESGLATLEQIANAVDKQYFEKLPNGVYITRLPIVVGHGATLLIDGSPSSIGHSESGKPNPSPEKELRLSQERGAFLINDGLFFAINTRLIGWSEQANTNAYYKEHSEFRPFYVSWGGSETYFAHSTVESFGYFQSKSYGITFSQYKEHDHMSRKPPKGWIIGSEFFDTYYGFYCYEAEDVALVGNTYRDNILYGIDPHDRSSRLLIANNHVYGTRKKHGIIISREVNDSWIVNNHTHNNHLSGIVLDRDSQRNVVANNTIYSNGGDGITLYESANNHIVNNMIADNTRQGIRVRNSGNTRINNNAIIRSGGYGIFAQVKDLSETDRDLSLDAYHTTTEIWASQDSLSGNQRGPIFIGPKATARLFDPRFVTHEQSKSFSLKGELAQYQHQILDIIYRKKAAVAIEPINTPSAGNTGS